MLSKIKKAADTFGLFSGVKTLAIALSGGADSVALLDAVLSLKDEYGIDVFAAHFNHKLRGEESQRDEQFVKSLCEKRNIKLVLGEGDVAKFAENTRQSTELAARQMRYEFLESLEADAIATAHTASDNLETVIFNLTRGSAIDGLCGIPPKRDRFIRPLIFCTRAEIEKYCGENALDFVTDSTNLSDDYSRNLIRHKVIPVLKEINSAAEENCTKTVISLAFDRDALEISAKREYNVRNVKAGLDVNGFAGLQRAVANRVIRRYCFEKTGVMPGFKHTDDLYNVAVFGGRCSLSGNAYAYRQKNILKIAFADDKPDFKVNVEKCENTFIKKGKKINNLLLKNLIDCDKIVGKLAVRSRSEGDKIRLLGRGCTKSLKQLYNENAIPVEQRKKLPVIADDIGPVWVCGVGCAQRVSADENSKFVYKISYEIILGGNNTNE